MCAKLFPMLGIVLFERLDSSTLVFPVVDFKPQQVLLAIPVVAHPRSFLFWLWVSFVASPRSSSSSFLFWIGISFVASPRGSSRSYLFWIGISFVASPRGSSRGFLFWVWVSFVASPRGSSRGLPFWIWVSFVASPRGNSRGLLFWIWVSIVADPRSFLLWVGVSTVASSGPIASIPPLRLRVSIVASLGSFLTNLRVSFVSNFSFGQYIVSIASPLARISHAEGDN